MLRMLTHLGLVLGLLLLIGLLIWQGVMAVLQLLASSGLMLLLLPLVWLPNVLPATEAWRRLVAPGHRPRFAHALLAIWMGRAVNDLLPVATIGGEIAKARLIYIWGCPAKIASASVIVDKTAQVIAVILWGLIGVACLLQLAQDDRLAHLALAGFGILALATAGFFFVQRAGMLGFLAHMGESLLQVESLNGITVSAREVDASVMEIYRARPRFAIAIGLRTLALLLQSAEVWVACLLLGHPIGVLEAVMVKSLTATLSDIAFIIPNAYGVQEGAFIIIGGLIGLPPDAALAVSLALRIRDLILDPAGLLALHQIEAHRWVKAAPEPESN
ncbi:MAG: flippase-like domain-containing protein [Gammaproteobacteria bacterium]|nr:flippase-like domain-containing protein [Gammaproteobacteria bacterium]